MKDVTKLAANSIRDGYERDALRVLLAQIGVYEKALYGGGDDVNARAVLFRSKDLATRALNETEA